MKSYLQLFISASLLFFIVTSCDKKKGCTDPNSLKYDASAQVDNGTCAYSSVIFYMSVINPARPVTVSVNGSTVGTITAQYPGGPGNCIAPGCAIYQCTSGQKINWVATEPGGTIWTGTVIPSPASDCIKVRVY